LHGFRSAISRYPPDRFFPFFDLDIVLFPPHDTAAQTATYYVFHLFSILVVFNRSAGARAFFFFRSSPFPFFFFLFLSWFFPPQFSRASFLAGADLVVCAVYSVVPAGSFTAALYHISLLIDRFPENRHTLSCDFFKPDPYTV